MKVTFAYFAVLLFLTDVFLLAESNDEGADVVDTSVDVDGNLLGPDDGTYYSDDCGENEIYSECNANPECRKTCENMGEWNSVPCAATKVCVNGCVCKEGYAFDEYEQICVIENRCPRVRH